MTTSLCIFEDRQYASLLPLSALRPVWDIRCGIFTLGEKIERTYAGPKISLSCRTSLAPLVQEEHPDRPVNALPTGPCLFLNGRILADTGIATRIPLAGPDTVFTHGPVIVAVRASGDTLRAITYDEAGLIDFSSLSALPHTETACTLVHHPWDVVNANGRWITADAIAFEGAPSRTEGAVIYDGAHLLNPGAIMIGRGSTIKPGVVLDAENGPIVIGSNVRVFPNAVIEGPAYIGHGSLVKIGAKIYENTSIGPVCKVGGEVEGCILHGYANKQHDGFLGHSYLCPWVNLGADTNNSDLKNNYSTVRVTINGTQIDSGSLFAGLIMGDHAKSGINTMFNTGSVVGVGCNVFGAGFPPKYLPAFSWGGSEGIETYDIDKCIAVARKVMQRRNQTLTSVAEATMRHLFTLTANERGR
jgi:UDP-N-acetylglucosamine diphosphorylase / glucose-1-phosphate thymidylyltransferase / UDP-N-acetylgalactosamine diphosphorylase / glucosamine-1-phosphate N-acetyltransferase / galactosamine-1-phosphate N-acetyltransferase